MDRQKVHLLLLVVSTIGVNALVPGGELMLVQGTIRKVVLLVLCARGEYIYKDRVHV